MSNPCIITGCALRLARKPDLWLPGDLFRVGDCYVFNGNQDTQEHRPRWVEGPPQYAKVLTLAHAPIGGAYGGAHERKGVFVAPIAAWTLNAAAEAYIRETSC